jgi:uncharacterized GH25 family protein
MYSLARKFGLFGATLLCVAAIFLAASLPAQAHELWVMVQKPEGGIFRANIGYGHHFPNLEPIPTDRVHIFDPLVLVTPKGKVTLDQVGENYAYQKKIDLKKGSYLVLGFYKPTFWSKGPEGWAQTDRAQRPDAVYVEEAVMYGKTILNLDGASDNGFISKPVGQKLEIVPLVNPVKVKVGDKMPLQVLLDGKPAKAVPVNATFGGFSDKDYQAFAGKTDAQGRIDFLPLKDGYWVVRASHTSKHPDPKKADELILSSSLTFNISR